MSSLLSRTQAVAANATSATLSSTAQGDLILVFAYNGTNNTIPSLPAGYTSLGTATTANGAMRVGYKASTGSETTTGTWTNATQVLAEVLRSSTGLAVVKAVPTFKTGTGTTGTFPGMTTTGNGANNFSTDGNSWVVGGIGARSASAGMNGNSTGLTNRANVTTAAVLDAADLSAYTDDTGLSWTTSSQWIAATVEVRDSGATVNMNATQGYTMLSQVRQNIIPGYFRRVHLNLGDAWGVNTLPFAQYQRAKGGATPQPDPDARAIENSDGVNFGLGSLGVYKRTDVGSPLQPSQIQHGPGRLLMFAPVLAGARVITIDCRYWPDSGAGSRPRILIRRDPELGIAEDVSVEAVAQSGTSFQTLTYSFTAPIDGVVELYREQQDTRADAWVLWDNYSVT